MGIQKHLLSFLSRYKYLGMILLIGLVVRGVYLKTNVFKTDLIIYQLWSLDMVKYGLKEFYTTAVSDYTPGYLYMLWIVGKFFYYFLNHGWYFDIYAFYKIVPIFFDLGNLIVIYMLAKKIVSEKRALLITLVFTLLPPVIINSTLWGQVDGIMTFFLLAGLYALISNHTVFAALLFSYGQSFKPVALLCLPFVAFYIYKKRGVWQLLIFGVVFLVLLLLLFVPFNKTGNLFTFFLERFSVTTTMYPFATVNAFNYWALFSTEPSGLMNRINNNVSMLLSFKYWGYVLFLFFYSSLLAKIRSLKNFDILWLIKCFGVSLWAMFLFFNGMHERHLYYGFFITVLALLLTKKNRVSNGLIALTLTLIYWINLVYAFNLAEVMNNFILTGWQIKTISFFNVLAFVYFFYTQIHLAEPEKYD